MRVWKYFFFLAVLWAVPVFLVQADEPTLDELKQQLNSENSIQRLEAAEALEAIGPNALPLAIKALDDKAWYVRHAAMSAISSFGAEAKSAVPALTKQLENEEPALRAMAAQALGHIGPAASDAVKPLSELLEDSQSLVKMHAAWALARIQPGKTKAFKKALPILINALKSEDPELKDEAIEALSEMGNSAVSPLMKFLKDNQEVSGEIAALDVLTALGPRAKNAAKIVAEALNSPDPMLRWHAARALGELESDNEEAIAALTAALGDNSPQVRSHAAFALGEIGAKNQEALNRLVELVGDENPVVRRASVEALKKIDPDRESVRPAFLRALRDSSPEVRAHAVEAIASLGKPNVNELIAALDSPETCHAACLLLAELGPKAQQAVPALSETLADENPVVRLEALIALGRIGEAAKPAIPKMLKALDDETEAVRFGAVFALGKMGPDAKAATKKLEALLSDDDAVLKAVSAWALSQIEPDNQEREDNAVPLLVGLLTNDDDALREGAARALVELKPEPEVIRPAMIKLFKSHDRPIVQRALDTLAQQIEEPALLLPTMIESLKLRPEARPVILAMLNRFGEKAAPALPVVRELLENDDPTTRTLALVALAGMGEVAGPAIPEMAKLLKDESQPAEVRSAAAYALGKQGPAAASVVDALHTALKSDAEFLPNAAAWALTFIQPETQNEKLIPYLVEGLDDPRPVARVEFCKALGTFEKLPKSALRALNQATEDDAEMVREAATEALEKLKP